MHRHRIIGLVLLVVIVANPASAQTAGTGIFVPKPRGAEDSLDPNAVASQTGATVIERSGDRLAGSVNSIANGVLRFSSPSFDNEIGIFTTAVREIQFPGGGVERGRDLIVLTNDDRLFGDIQGMTTTDVAFESDAVGFVKINSRCIKQMGFQGAMGALTRTDFSGGRPAPLQVVGSWQIADGMLHLNPPSAATLPLEQSGAVTVVLQFAHEGRLWSLSLFADQPGKAEADLTMPGNARALFNAEGNALTLAFTSNSYSVSEWKGDGRRVTIAPALAVRSGEAEEIRFAYDPATTKTTLSVNSKNVIETKAPDGPKQGKYVVFSVQDSCDLKSFAVFDGAEVTAKVSDDADPNDQTVVCRSGERLRAESIALEDGVFTVKTAFSDKPLSVPAEKVASITLSKAGRATPPAPENAVQIRLPRSLITAELVALTDKTAVVRSPYLGEIKIARDAIQSLRFLAPGPSQ